jgi:hypothetical protein
VVSFTPRPLYLQGKNPWYPLYRKVGGHRSRFGRYAIEKKCLDPDENQTPAAQLTARRYYQLSHVYRPIYKILSTINILIINNYVVSIIIYVYERVLVPTTSLFLQTLAAEVHLLVKAKKWANDEG